MRKTKFATLAAAFAAAAVGAAGVAHADGNPDGRIEVKLLATAVLPSGSVSSVPNDAAQVVSGGLVTQTAASNNVTPTVAIEYYVRHNISLETICCVSAHHVYATQGTLAGTTLVDHALVVPATLTAKYHFTGLGLIQPYIGAGPAVFIWVADRPSAAVRALGVTRTMLSSNFGGVLQAGFDLPVGHGYALSLDAKKYFVQTDAHFDTPTANAESVRLNLNPWVVSAGVAFRF